MDVCTCDIIWLCMHNHLTGSLPKSHIRQERTPPQKKSSFPTIIDFQGLGYLSGVYHKIVLENLILVTNEFCGVLVNQYQALAAGAALKVGSSADTHMASTQRFIWMGHDGPRYGPHTL